MSEIVPGHPEISKMVAFIEGRLSGEELAAVSGHLRTCDDCRTVVSETARFEREEEQRVPRRRKNTWWLALAAGLAAVMMVPVYRWNRLRTDPIARLAAAAPHDHRTVGARLVGFPWAQLQSPGRGLPPADPAEMKLIGAAGEVLSASAGDHSSESLHAVGVAYLVSGRRAEAVDTLTRAAAGSKDARIWSDLAAAQYAVAVDDEKPKTLSDALATANHAVELDPRSSEAHFNRALILGQLGVVDQARKEWLAYLDVDSGSGWSAEAHAHLQALDKHTRRFNRKLLESMPAAVLVGEFPMESRINGEGLLLFEWANAVVEGKEKEAEARLDLARAIGAALEKRAGEALLADAVAAIDQSHGDTRRTFVDAHRLYGLARIAFSKRNVNAAAPQFERAAALFASVGSPMEGVARCYTASVAFAQDRGEEALDDLNRLWQTVDRRRHQALAAQIQWSLAVSAGADGDWRGVARSAESASTVFRTLGETQNAAVVEALGANALDMTGDDSAWTRHVRTFAALAGTPERARFLRAAAISLDRFGRPAAAEAMNELAIDELRNDPAQHVAALIERARFARHAADPEAARVAVQRARTAAGAISDAAVGELLNVTVDIADAALRCRKEPQAAIAQLDRAEAYFSKGRQSGALSEVYLERAKAHRAAGDDAGALADYAAALRQVNTEQGHVTDGDLRLRLLDTASEAVDETIELDLAHRSVAEAFAVADGTRELAGQRQPSSPLTAAAERMNSAPPRTALIEYAVLPHEVEAFCVAGGQLTVKKVVIERGELASRIAVLGEKVRTRGSEESIRASAAALYQLLFAPLEPRLGAADQLVVVADRELFALPFALLYDQLRHQYLAERFAIRLATSAASAAESATFSMQPAVVIADPSAAGWPRLPGSRAEGEQIAISQGAILLAGDAATRERVIDAMSRSALVHYSGHADSDAANSYGALVLADDRGASSFLTSREIARLSLKGHPLVVLAACGTFRGDATHTAGMPGLTRALLLAGASSVVGTLWDLDDDAAAPLFLRFHKLLRTGMPPAQALRSAQVGMIHASDPRLCHPAAWAPAEITEHSSRRISWF